MNNGTCIAFLLFYVFRHYKRLCMRANRKEMIADLKKCRLLLVRMESNLPPEDSADTVQALMDRINSFGYDMKLQFPLRYADADDRDVITAMLRLTDDIIRFARSPFYRRYAGDIFKRLLVLHNLPRVILDDSSGDATTLANFHVPKQDALKDVPLLMDNKR